MKQQNQVFTLVILLATYAPGATAEDDPVSTLTTPDSSVSIGIGYMNGEREQFGIYDNVRDDDTLLLLDADVNKRDDATGTWMTLRARNLGIDSRSIELGYDRQGDWGIDLEYDEITRSAQYTVNTGMTGLGTMTQILPFDGTGYIPGSGNNVTLGTERKGTGVILNKFLTRNLNFTVDFKNQEKKGTRHWGRGGAPEFVAEPIDSTTRQLEAKLDYAGEQLQLSGGYYASWYNNHYDDNVYTLGQTGVVSNTSSNRLYYLSLPLDNQSQQIYLNGGYSFAPTTRGTFRLSYTHATADETLSTNVDPRYGISTAAPGKLDGELNTTLVFLGLTSRPMKNMSLVANLRYHKVDEQTPRHLIICTTCDGTTDEVHGTPLDYETLSGKLEGTYRLQDGYSLVGGIDRRQQDRTVPFGNDNDGDGFDNERYVPFRADLDETTYRIQLRKSMSATLNGSLALSHSVRDGSSYADAIHSFDPTAATPEPPAIIDPLNIADRKRNKLRATADWSPTDRTDLQFNYELARDKYSGHTFGLRKGKAQVFSLDSAFRMNQDWQSTAWYSYDMNRAKQNNWRDANNAAGSNFSEALLYDTLTHTGNSVGLGLEGTVNTRLKVGADLEWTRTRSEYDQDIVPSNIPVSGTSLFYPGTTIPLPDITSTATRLKLFADYGVSKHSDLRFELIHERWKTDDWTWQFSDGSPFIYTGSGDSDGTMVIQDPRQHSTFVGIRYVYKFR